MNTNDKIIKIIYDNYLEEFIVKYQSGKVYKYSNLNIFDTRYENIIDLVKKQYNMSFYELEKLGIIKLKKNNKLLSIFKKFKIKNFVTRKRLVSLAIVTTLILTDFNNLNSNTKEEDNSLKFEKELVKEQVIETPNPTISPTIILTPPPTPTLSPTPSSLTENILEPTIIPNELSLTSDDIEYSSNLTNYKFGKNLYITIDTKISYSKILKKVGKQTKDGCLTYSLKYADYIFNNSDSKSLSTNRLTTNALSCLDEETILKIMAIEILEGRPCIIQVSGEKSGNLYTRHFVLVVGIKNNYDFNNLDQTDFLIMDPGSASLKILNVTPSSKKRKRFLLSGMQDTRSYDYDYLVLVYNNPDKYITAKSLHLTKY